MKFFPSQPNNDLKKRLAASRQEFKFDQEAIKSRLLYSLNDAPMKAPDKTLVSFRALKYSTVLASVLILISGTFALASQAQPGDRLFALNKWSEKLVLALPLSMDQKAAMETRIVNKRLQALEAVKLNSPATISPQTETRQLETIKESDEAVQNALESVASNKKLLETQGQTANAQRLEKVLNELDNLAAQHEKQIQGLEQSALDDEARQTIQLHLIEIKNARTKARTQIKLPDAESGSQN